MLLGCTIKYYRTRFTFQKIRVAGIAYPSLLFPFYVKGRYLQESITCLNKINNLLVGGRPNPIQNSPSTYLIALSLSLIEIFPHHFSQRNQLQNERLYPS